MDITSVRSNVLSRPEAIKVRRVAVSAPPAEGKVSLPSLGIEAQPTRVLIAVCNTLAVSFEAWKSSASAAEMEELRQAVSQLQQRLSPPHEVELMDILSTTLHSGGRA